MSSWTAVDSEWAAIARDLAAVVRRAEALRVEAGQLAVRREKLERRLAEMLERAGGETRRLAPDQPPLSHLSTAIPCPSGCEVAARRVLHSHYADGVTQVWE